MTIFDDIPRPDVGPPEHGEPAFAYLNRSGRPEADRVRRLVEEWIARYPASSRDNLVSRFRSLNDDAHHSAFFELFIHELVIGRGHRVVAVEPKLPHTMKSPDFLIEAAEGHRLYLECALATGRSAEEAAPHARLDRALKAIERAQSPAHYLSVAPHGDPSGEVSMKRLTRLLEKWVAGLPGGDKAMERSAPSRSRRSSECSARPSARAKHRRRRAPRLAQLDHPGAGSRLYGATRKARQLHGAQTRTSRARSPRSRRGDRERRNGMSPRGGGAAFRRAAERSTPPLSSSEAP